ncbi:MAG: T9SS type A sorting domain-containing protein, partial [Schleiferiaceae bacterium]|nr:T9SS type A sorting domain-containing protein [Schleiferiaceae bacterium]
PNFDLSVFAGARETAVNANETDVLVFHGATDAPAVDVNENTVPVPGLLTNLAYGDFDGYLELTTADYELEVQVAGGGAVVAIYEAPLATLNLDGEAIVVLASGFLDPTQNNDGPEFGLWAALSSGGNLVPLTDLSSISAETIGLSNQSRVFPNPARQIINFEIDATVSGQMLVEVLDLHGRVVSGNTTNVFGKTTVSLDVEQLSSGTYFVRATVDGNIAIHKILIE